MSQHPFNVLDHIRLTGGSLYIASNPSFSGSGGGGSGPPKPPKAPVKPKKKPKK